MQQELAPAVVDFIEQLAARFRGIGRSQHEEVGVVLDHAAGIARRLVEADNAAVARIPRIEFALHGADHALVGARIPECRAVGERLDLVDEDRGHARVGNIGRGEEQQAGVK